MIFSEFHYNLYMLLIQITSAQLMNSTFSFKIFPDHFYKAVPKNTPVHPYFFCKYSPTK